MNDESDRANTALYQSRQDGADSPPSALQVCQGTSRKGSAGGGDSAICGGQGSGSAAGGDEGTIDPDSDASWIEVVLVDEVGRPLPGVAWRVVAADGATFNGVFDETGVARVDPIAPGTALINFPDLDRRAWQAA